MKNRKQIFGIQKLMFFAIAFAAIIGLMTACDQPRGGSGPGNNNGNGNGNGNSNDVIGKME